MSSIAFATLHLARFDELRPGREVTTLEPGHNVAFWGVGFDRRVAGLSMSDEMSSVWAAIGLHPDESSARAVLDSGSTSGEAIFRGATQQWSALLQPFAHRGEVNWLDAASPGLIFTEPAAVADDDGADKAPLVVITTVGWDIGPGFDLKKVMDFDAGVGRVYAALQDAEGLSFRHVVQFPLADGIDPMTITCWRDDRSMRAAAYRPGVHKTELDRFRQAPTADRTSFTRFRILDERGSWHGDHA